MTVSKAIVRRRSTAPGYLVEIGVEPVARYSTRGPVSWDTRKWMPSGAEVQGLSADGQGGLNARLMIPNHNWGWGRRLLADHLGAEFPVAVYALYQWPDGTPEAQQEFSGVCQSWRIGERFVELQLGKQRIVGRHSPRVGWTSPWALAPGEIKEIGGKTYQII